MQAFYDSHIHSVFQDGNAEKSFEMLNTLADLGVTDANILALTYRIYPVENNLTVLYCREAFKRIRLRVFGGLYYNAHLNYYGMPFLDQAKELVAMGCDGIKMIEMKPNYRRYIGFGLNSKIYDAMFDWLEEQQVPIIAHVNDPDTFWDRSQMNDFEVARGWWYGDGTCLSYEEIYSEMFERMDRNPNLKINFAHGFFMGEQPDRMAALLDKYPNMGFDLTPGWEMFVNFRKDFDKWTELFRKYRHRIFYGTDSDEGCDAKHLKNLHLTVSQAIAHDATPFDMPHMPGHEMCGFGLDAEAQQMIFRDNGLRFAGDPHPLDWERFAAHTEKICGILALESGNEARIAQLRKNCAELR